MGTFLYKIIPLIKLYALKFRKSLLARPIKHIEMTCIMEHK